jgi:beta-glucosidase
VHAGLDLEMPSSGGAWDDRVAAALDDGTLAETDLDLACARVVALARRVAAGRPDDERAGSGDGHAGSVDGHAGSVDGHAGSREERDGAGAGCPGHDEADARRDAHHALARRAAAAGTVMLTNDGILPLTPTGRIALIGSFAETPRYQGAGSSQVNPTRLDTALDAMRARLGDGAELTYARGYDPVTGEATAEDVAEAVRAAAAAEVVVLVVGLPAGYESEGFDRTDLRLPAWHDALVEAVVAANPRTVVVLVNGAPVEVDWAERPAALVEAYLGGQAGGSALVDVLVGDAEPGGRLAESFPVRMTDLPADTCFADGPTQVVYRETCYVGYRFHDTFGVAPRFCFGHGLGYTTFDLSGLEVTGDDTDRTVRVTVTNTGARAGSTVVQVYLRDVESSVHRPAQELAGFARVHLDAGASSSVEVALDRRAFAVWDVASGDWAVEAGAFEVRVGFSSRDVRATTTIEVASDDVVSPVPAPTAAVATDLELAALLGHPVPAPRPLLPLTYDSTLDDLALVPLGRPLRAGLVKAASGMLGDEDDPAVRTMMAKVVGQMPLRAVVASSGGRLSFRTLDAALRVLNLGRRRRS